MKDALPLIQTKLHQPPLPRNLVARPRLTITSTILDDQQAITSLQGTLIDQAALFGVLMALYDLRLPLLSVQCLRGSNQQ